MVDNVETVACELSECCGESERVTVQSLVDDAELSVWWVHGPGRRTYRLPVDDAPDAGGTLYAPRDVYTESDDDVTLVEIPVTLWGDYCGDIVGRANHAAILETHAGDVVELEWAHDSHALALRLDGTIPTQLADEIRGLSEYPLIDDESLWPLEQKLEEEDWELYGRDDVRLTVERKLEALRYGDDVELSWILTDKLCEAPSSGALDRIALRARYGDCGEPLVTWESETATGGYFRGLDELADVIVAARVSAARRWFARFVAREYGETVGQLSL